MSTRSAHGIGTHDGEFKAAYVHYDGGPKQLGAALFDLLRRPDGAAIFAESMQHWGPSPYWFAEWKGGEGPVGSACYCHPELATGGYRSWLRWHERCTSNPLVYLTEKNGADFDPLWLYLINESRELEVCRQDGAGAITLYGRVPLDGDEPDWQAFEDAFDAKQEVL